MTPDQEAAVARLWADYRRFVAGPGGADPARAAEVTSALVLVLAHAAGAKGVKAAKAAKGPMEGKKVHRDADGNITFIEEIRG